MEEIVAIGKSGFSFKVQSVQRNAYGTNCKTCGRFVGKDGILDFEKAKIYGFSGKIPICRTCLKRG
jgi:hypothetical protein